MSEIKICGAADVIQIVEQFNIKKVMSCLGNYKIVDEMYKLTPSLISLNPAYWNESDNWLRLQMYDTTEPERADAPTSDEVIKGIAFGASAIKSGNNLLVHCQLGFSRSPAMAIGSILNTGSSIEEAYTRAEKARGAGIRMDPNSLIIQHIDNYLKLNGELVKYNNEYRVKNSAGLKRDYKKLMEVYIGDIDTLSVILENISALDNL